MAHLGHRRPGHVQQGKHKDVQDTRFLFLCLCFFVWCHTLGFSGVAPGSAPSEKHTVHSANCWQAQNKISNVRGQIPGSNMQCQSPPSLAKPCYGPRFHILNPCQQGGHKFRVLSFPASPPQTFSCIPVSCTLVFPSRLSSLLLGDSQSQATPTDQATPPLPSSSVGATP